MTLEHAINKQHPLMGLSIDEPQFNEILEALREKKKVILHGGPGVAKTFVAKQLAFALTGSHDSERVQMLQFHQSDYYEDLLRCRSSEPWTQPTPRYGIFHQFCRQAQQEEGQWQPYVLIIDDINRDNLRNIVGDLTRLIKPENRWKRHTVRLADLEDADERFYLPENLHLIGIMSSAHFSPEMEDDALWQRFQFITIQPEFTSQAFINFLLECGASKDLVKKLISCMTCLNEEIAVDENLGPEYMIGRSYFYPRHGINPDEAWYCWVIEAEIMPLIRAYWSGDERKVERLRTYLLA